MPQQSMFDDVADDLAIWIDQTATEVALALAPRTSPFAVHLSEDQKLQVYRWRLFNPDGSPNVAGRNAEIARLGAENFGQVYKAVIRRWPELKPPEEATDTIEALAPMPAGPPGAPPAGTGLPMPPGPLLPLPPGPPGPLPGQGPPPVPGPPPGMPQMGG